MSATSGLIEIKLPYAQYQACVRWGTSRHVYYLSAAKTVGKARAVWMPYPGWNSLADLLAEQVFTKWGKVNRKHLAENSSLGAPTAMTTIRRALAKVQGHPAMRNEAVFGYSADEFIVWPASLLHNAGWLPWPTPYGPAHRLVPIFEGQVPAVVSSTAVIQIRGLTFWQPRPYEGDTSAFGGWSVSKDEQTAGT